MSPNLGEFRCDLPRAMASHSRSPPPAESPPPAPTTIKSIGDDLLLEIFIRLPSLVTLVRAAFTCRSFLHAVRSSPTFRRSFRTLHPPPLIGLLLIHIDGDIASFAPLRGSADPDLGAVIRGSDFFLTRVPDNKGFWSICDCRDGYLLLHNWENRLHATYSPIAGVMEQIPHPPEAVRELFIQSSPEDPPGSLRLVCVHEDGLQVRPVVYSSNTREWQVLPWTQAKSINENHGDDDKHCLPPWGGTLVDGLVYWIRHDYVIVLDTKTLQFSSMDLPPVIEGQRPFVVGETKDGMMCMVAAVDDTLTLAVWIWRADDDRVEKWILDKEIRVGELPVLKMKAVNRGVAYFHMIAIDSPNTVPLRSCFSFCLEAAQLKKIFAIYEYEIDRSHPYIMPWPSALVCNKVNPRLEGA